MIVQFWHYHKEQGGVPQCSGWIVQATDADDCTLSMWHCHAWEDAVRCMSALIDQGAYSVEVCFREV